MNGCHYLHCTQCGLIYVDRFATAEQMLEAYTGGGFKSWRRRILGPFRKLTNVKGYAQSMQRAREIFAVASQAAKPLANPQFLDIGCNKGFLLTAAIEQGYTVSGVELVKELIHPFINSYPQFRKNIYSEKFSVVAPQFGDGFFDLITAIDVIEHFEDPIKDIQEIYRVLKPGGVFVIQTPDVDCVQATSQGCHWAALKPLEHLHLFGRKNFPGFAVKLGFREVSIRDPFEEADGNFTAILRK
jgi:SAM-dependent methyltransferase